MISTELPPIDLAHTKHMREDKVPLCDRHHFRMRPEQPLFFAGNRFQVCIAKLSTLLRPTIRVFRLDPNNDTITGRY